MWTETHDIVFIKLHLHNFVQMWIRADQIESVIDNDGHARITLIGRDSNFVVKECMNEVMDAIMEACNDADSN